MKEQEITEDYVSDDTALLLKEKGFYADCPHANPKCTTMQMAAKWLRTKGMCINININERETYDANGNHKGTYSYWRYDISNTTDGVYIHESDEECQFFEDAMDAAIQNCLNNLIKY